jgi:hypothetical protein
MSNSTSDYGIIDYSKHVWLTEGHSDLKFGDTSHHNDFIDMLIDNKQWIIDFNQYTIEPKKQEVVYYIDNHLNVYKEIHNFDVYPFSKPKDRHIVCPVLEHEGMSEPLTDSMIDIIKTSTTRASIIHLYSNQLKKTMELNAKMNQLKVEQSLRIHELLEDYASKPVADKSCKLC